MRAHRHDEMPVDVEGWLSSPRVQRMTAAERGMFFELLCRAWADQDCSLPEDEDELKFLARATDEEWGSGSKRVLAMFDSKGGRLTNAKQIEVLEAQNSRLAAAKANRDRVAKYRAGMNGKHQENSDEEESEEMPPADNRFSEFWRIYPKREAKPKAISSWKKIKPSEVDRILKHVCDKAMTEDWKKEGGKYVPLPATYLNQRRWEDEGPTVAPEPDIDELVAREWKNSL